MRKDKAGEQYFRLEWRVLEAVHELNAFLNELLRDALSPEELVRLAAGVAFDPSLMRRIAGEEAQLDPYRVLGLEKTASDEEVKKRYRELVHKLHPDTAGVQGTEFLLGVVMAAYRQISRQRGWQS